MDFMKLKEIIRNIDAYDYIDKLKLADKLLGSFAILFWFVSLLSINPEPAVIWFTGMVLPLFLVSANKLSVLLALSICVVAYIVTSVVVTHKLLCFFPHFACCICVVADDLVSRSLKKVENSDYYLREKTREIEFLKCSINEQAQQNKLYKEKVDELYILVNDEEELDSQKYKSIKEKIEYLWVMYD